MTDVKLFRTQGGVIAEIDGTLRALDENWDALIAREGLLGWIRGVASSLPLALTLLAMGSSLIAVTAIVAVAKPVFCPPPAVPSPSLRVTAIGFARASRKLLRGGGRNDSRRRTGLRGCAAHSADSSEENSLSVAM